LAVTVQSAGTAADVKTFATNDFRLHSGVVMPAVTIAYQTLGVLAPDRDNVGWSPMATPAAPI
jgi:homoserine O-acetyltransferase/O-succinyltransferase